jgi:hypothetical protein
VNFPVGCYGTNIPLNPNQEAAAVTGSDFTIPIPAQTISFNLTAIDGNKPPTPPIVTGPTTGIPNAPYTFTATATDPDNDQLRYGFDWDNNASVDQWMPAITYVPSNTPQSAPYSWLTPATYTFQVLAQDNKGDVSSWTSHTIAIKEDGICGTANGDSFSIAPTTNLCLKGSASPTPSGAGPWNWTCNGLGGGANAPCSASTCQPVNDYGTCDCSTEQKRHEFGTTCNSDSETIDCTSSEKNACRDFNWREVAP